MNEIRVLGRLMTDEEYRRSNPDAPYYFSTVFGGNKFKLKPVSELPENISKIDEFTCVADYLDQDFRYCSENEIKQKLENKLIIFTPKEVERGFLCYDPVYAYVNNDELLKIDNFVVIPVIDLDKLGLRRDELESKLYNKNIILIKPKISYAQNDAPRFILVKEKKLLGHGYNFYLYSGFDQIILQGMGVVINFNENDIVSIKFDVENDGNMIIDDGEDDIVYIPFSLESKYIDKFNEVNNISNDSLQENFNSKIEKEYVEESKYKFILNDFIPYAEKRGLLYNKKDLINFDISIKTSSLVILEGMSGTGKSQLVRTYAEVLGMGKYNGLKFISVSPAWCDDSDILGYVDYKNMLYREADYGLVRFLIEASNNQNHQYIVCFDEMNLAKVEHYFSQFLSVLENDSDDRFLTIYNEDLENRLYNSNVYPSKIKIGKNIAFVGTVNVDESTFNFSDKVLDRASVIKLSMQSFINMQKYFANCNLNSREFELLDKLQLLFMHENPKFGIGYRVVKQINDYLGYIDSNEIYSRSEAIDNLLIQRVFSKLRGTSEQISNIIGILDEDGNLKNSRIEEIFEEFNDISSFENIRKEIKLKAKELKTYGYTI